MQSVPVHEIQGCEFALQERIAVTINHRKNLLRISLTLLPRARNINWMKDSTEKFNKYFEKEVQDAEY